MKEINISKLFFDKLYCEFKFNKYIGELNCSWVFESVISQTKEAITLEANDFTIFAFRFRPLCLLGLTILNKHLIKSSNEKMWKWVHSFEGK